MKTSKSFQKIIKIITGVITSVLIILIWLDQASLFTFGASFPLEFFECITSYFLLSSISLIQFFYLFALLILIALSIAISVFIIKKNHFGVSIILLVLILIYHIFLYDISASHKFIIGRAKFVDAKINKKLVLKDIKLRQGDIKNTRVYYDTRPNVIIIIMESIDNFWISKESNYIMPKIKTLMEDNINFTNIEQSLHGYNSERGINDAFTAGGKVGFPNILSLAGYTQIAMFGFERSSLKFGDFFKSFGYDKIIDKIISDTQLFNNSFVEYEKLKKKNKPFNMTIVTKDTHDKCRFSKFFSELTKEEFIDNRKKLDTAVFDFVKKIRKNDKDTIIAVFNDHYARSNDFDTKVKNFKNKRKMVFFIINGKNKKIKIQGTTRSIGATILQYMKIEHNNIYFKKYCL